MTWTGSTPGAPGPPEAEVFFDARRGIYYARPALRGWSHVVWFGLSVVAGPLLLARAHGAQQFTARAIYAISVSALFGVSALYHRGRLDRIGPAADAAPGPHDDLLSHRGHGHSGAAADLARGVRAGLPDHGVDAGRSPRPWFT